MEIVLTKTRKHELIRSFEDIQKAVDANYLPRKNTTIGRLNGLAVALQVKGMTKGCGRCMIKDAGRILKALQDSPVELVVPPKKGEGKKTEKKADGKKKD